MYSVKHHPLVSNFYIILALIKLLGVILNGNQFAFSQFGVIYLMLNMNSKHAKLMVLWPIFQTKLMLFEIPKPPF